MNHIVFGIILFLNVLSYFIFFDVLLSWLRLAGVKFRPKFLGDILDPLYGLVKKNLPVFFGPLDFTPIFLLLILMFLGEILLFLFPGVRVFIPI